MNELEVDDFCDIVTSICSGVEVYERIRQQCRFLYDSIREGNTPMFFVPRRSIDNTLLRTLENGLEALTVANRNKTSTRSFNCRRNIQSVTQILIILSTAEMLLRCVCKSFQWLLDFLPLSQFFCSTNVCDHPRRWNIHWNDLPREQKKLSQRCVCNSKTKLYRTFHFLSLNFISYPKGDFLHA
jgi:hypothetical protein